MDGLNQVAASQRRVMLSGAEGAAQQQQQQQLFGKGDGLLLGPPLHVKRLRIAAETPENPHFQPFAARRDRRNASDGMEMTRSHAVLGFFLLFFIPHAGC